VHHTVLAASFFGRIRMPLPRYLLAFFLVLLSWGAAAQAAVAPGLLATYFDNKDFTGKSITRIDAGINFNWGAAAPVAGFGADTFSAMWQGYLIAPQDGEYTIATSSDDGIEVWIGRKLVIHNMTDHSATRDVGKVALKAGQKYEVLVRYYENTGGASIMLSWAYGTIAEAAIPAAAFEATTIGTSPALPAGNGKGFQATYFKNEDFTGDTVSRVEQSIEKNWGSSGPVPGIGATGPWSAIWEGTLQVPATDLYTLTTSSTGCLLVYVDGKLVIDRAARHTSQVSNANLSLVGGKGYHLKVKFSTFGSAAKLYCWWAAGQFAPQLIVGGYITPPPSDTTPFSAIFSSTSRVNPAWLAGTINSATGSVSALVNGQAVPVARESANTWYVDALSATQPIGVALVPWAATRVVVHAGAESMTQEITWEPTDLSQTYAIDPTVIRVGDSLLVANGTPGKLLEIDTDYKPAGGFQVRLSGPTTWKFPVRFTTAGTFTVQARTDGVLTGRLVVQVVSADLKGPIACEINYQRIKDIAVSHPSAITVTSNAAHLMKAGIAAPVTGGVRLNLMPLASGKPVVQVRINGVAGPIVTRQEVDEFTMRTSAERLMAVDQEFPDGSLLGTASLIQAPWVKQLEVKMHAFVSGVLFTNGTNRLDLNTSSFNASHLPAPQSATHQYQIIRAANVTNGFCHNFTVYQSGVQISY
jgi:hypothetical protein